MSVGAALHQTRLCVYVCSMLGRHSPDSISLVERGDHGRRVFRHESHQQLQHVVDVLILRRKEDAQVNKGVGGG